ncbi:MAG: transposase [Clostridium sp.]|nr:transposase [Clostridium sp.]
MAKRRILRPDTVLKNYWSNNEQFADIFNAVLFEGKQIIRPEELENADTEEVSILKHRDYVESIKAARDNIKVCRKSTVYGVEFVMLGLESQEHIHYAMPLRVMGYDYGMYKKQYDCNAVQYKKSDGLDADEYLSRMKRTDRFTPVITIVVYYGEKPWDGAVSLHEMLDIPEIMKAFVNDYKVILVEARQSNLIFQNTNNADFFNLLEILLDKSSPLNETRNKAIEYAREHNVNKDVVLTVAGATNCKIDYDSLSMKGEADMCTVFEETRIEGEAKGIIETGFDFGLSENDILERLQKKLNVPFQIAQGYLERFGKQTV